MRDLYTKGEYLANTGTWHAEDSEWKADQISAMLQRNGVRSNVVHELGCGAGGVLCALSEKEAFRETSLSGYDISPQAVLLANSRPVPRVQVTCADYFALETRSTPDVLMAIDVFEHVPDYMGFLENCQRSAPYKIYHIPLELHVSGLLRGALLHARRRVGHIHYFSAETALEVLKDTGHTIVEATFTDLAIDLFHKHPSVKTALANIPRWVVSKVSKPVSARWFGGYSLLVLAR